jgi:arylsulfatase A-like enzyme
VVKPNIIVILADDLGYGDIGAFGNPDVITPNLDAFANESVCLTQHYSASPVCAPARAALLTGRYPHRTGAIDTLEALGLDRLSLREKTIADVLKQADYFTGLVGKWHLGAFDPKYHPNARGFDEAICFRGGWSDYWQWRLDYNGSYRECDGRYLTDVFTQEALEFIKRHRDRPFFLHLAYNAPHFPFQVPDEDAKPFRETGKFTEGVSLIYGMIRRMDKGIGQLLNALEEFGIAENTIVLFTSDNGPQFSGKDDMCTVRFNCQFNGCKGLVYEGGIRVPAIIRWPAGLDGGRIVSEMTHFTDWFPTFAAAANAKLPEELNIDGENILPVLRGHRHSSDRPRFWQWNRYSPVRTCNAAVRHGYWKLVRPVIQEAMAVLPEHLELDRRIKYDPGALTDIYRDSEPERVLPEPPPPLLFKLDEDPFERCDLADRYPDMVERLGNALDNWFEEVERERISNV